MAITVLALLGQCDRAIIKIDCLVVVARCSRKFRGDERMPVRVVLGCCSGPSPEGILVFSQPNEERFSLAARSGLDLAGDGEGVPKALLCDQEEGRDRVGGGCFARDLYEIISGVRSRVCVDCRGALRSCRL